MQLNLKIKDNIAKAIVAIHKIIISIPKKKKISLSDRFKEYNGKNLAKDFSWDENIGRELW